MKQQHSDILTSVSRSFHPAAVLDVTFFSPATPQYKSYHYMLMQYKLT